MKHIDDDNEEDDGGSQYSYNMNDRRSGFGIGSGSGGAGDGGSSVGHSSTGYSSTRSGGVGSYSTRNRSGQISNSAKAATTSTSNIVDDPNQQDQQQQQQQQQHVSMGEFFQVTLNSGVGDGVVCFKLLVLGTLLLASLVIGNAAFVFTTAEVVETYKDEVRCLFFY